MAHTSTYRAEQTVLHAVLKQNGGKYIAISHSAAHNFRRRCYELRNLLRKRALARTGNDVSPYDDLSFQLPAKGEPDDNVLTIVVNSALPKGELTTLDGRPLVLDVPEQPFAEGELSLDLGDLNSIASEVEQLIREDEAMNETRNETSSNFFDEEE